MAQKKKNAEAKAEEVAGATITDASTKEMTNVRHEQEFGALVAELNQLALEDDDAGRGFRIGDLVEKATRELHKNVADLKPLVKLSRTRMCDCRRTAVAFAGEARQKNLPFHVYTLSARAAKPAGMTAEEVLAKVEDRGFDTVRQVSKFLGGLRRQKAAGDAAKSGALLAAKHGELLDRCHHDDFRNVITQIEAGTLKLVIADGMFDGKRKSTTSATSRTMDGNTEAEAQAAIEDLLKLTADKMVAGGTALLFRPGAAMDPPWLSAAIESTGWRCAWALTWDKRKAKPGRGDAPYGIASERILVLCREGEKLVAHDDSPRDDVLEFKPIQPRNADAEPHHQHEKPLDLMRYFISKHTHPGDTVFEPFGGSGAGSRAALELKRHWVYCESNKEAFDAGAARIAAAAENQTKVAG